MPDDADIHDPASWWLGMPALGHTQSIEAISHAKQTMAEGEFRRAFGNQRTRSNERAIPEMTWRVACRSDVAPTGRLSFAVVNAKSDFLGCRPKSMRRAMFWAMGRK